ncbi:MAG: hypothetical protein MJ231_02635 [bacterium]|nr:hypothetical protein [bacterium]
MIINNIIYKNKSQNSDANYKNHKRLRNVKICTKTLKFFKNVPLTMTRTGDITFTPRGKDKTALDIYFVLFTSKSTVINSKQVQPTLLHQRNIKGGNYDFI